MPFSWEEFFDIFESAASTFLRIKSRLGEDSLPIDEELERLWKGVEGSGRFDDWRLLWDLGCSFDETAMDRKESIENGEEGAPMFWGTAFPTSLFKYKGANIGGGTGNNDWWCPTSLTFKLAAASTAAVERCPSFAVDVYWESEFGCWCCSIDDVALR